MAKKKQIGICRLCLQERELMNSHIIPEFMYKNIYDSKHDKYGKHIYYTIDTNNSAKKEQKGSREHLLCEDCEQKLSKYEKYANETIYAPNKKCVVKLINKTKLNELPATMVNNWIGFDYVKFKIFLNSLLWRLLISKNPKIHIDNTDAIEKLRQSILEENPLDCDEFGCIVNCCVDSKNVIMRPKNKTTDINGNEIICVFIDGFLYEFYLTSKNVSDIFFLQTDGTLLMIERSLLEDNRLMSGITPAYNKLNEIYNLNS